MRIFPFIALIVCVSALAFGHHGTSVTYQVDKTITVTGTVTEFDFVYPHPQLYFDVKAADGTIQKWGTEWGPTPAMLRNMNVGWTRNSVKPGDQVIVVCNPHKVAGSTACLLKELTVNGQKMKLGGGGAAAAGYGGGEGKKE